MDGNRRGDQPNRVKDEMNDTYSENEDEDDDDGSRRRRGESGRISGKKREMSENEAEEKKAERRAANRRSAFQSRQRRKILIEDLQRTVAALSKDNNDLRKSNEELRVQLEATMLENRQFRLQQQMSNTGSGGSGGGNGSGSGASADPVPSNVGGNSSSSSTNTASSSPNMLPPNNTPAGVNMAAMAALHQQIQLAALMQSMGGGSDASNSSFPQLFGPASNLGMFAAGFGGLGTPGMDAMFNARLALAAAAGATPSNINQGMNTTFPSFVGDFHPQGPAATTIASAPAPTSASTLPSTAPNSDLQSFVNPAAEHTVVQSSGTNQASSAMQSHQCQQHNRSTPSSAPEGGGEGKNGNGADTQGPTTSSSSAPPMNTNGSGISDIHRALIRGLANSGMNSQLLDPSSGNGGPATTSQHVTAGGQTDQASNRGTTSPGGGRDRLASLSAAAALNNSSISEALRNFMNKK